MKVEKQVCSPELRECIENLNRACERLIGSKTTMDRPLRDFANACIWCGKDFPQSDGLLNFPVFCRECVEVLEEHRGFSKWYGKSLLSLIDGEVTRRKPRRSWRW